MERIAFAYHAVADGFEPGAATVTVRRFREHCAALAGDGWRAVPLAAAFDDTDARVFVLTFDDAYECLGRIVFPECARYGWRGTAFVPAGLTGADGAWDVGAWRRHRHITWEALADLVAAGWEIGAHGVSHRAIPDLDDARARDELVRGREIIEQRLGVIVACVAWPFGAVSRRAVRFAREAGYVRGVTMRPGAIRPGGDPLRMPRWPIYRMDRAAHLRVRLEGPSWARAIEAARVRTVQQFARGTRVRMAGAMDPPPPAYAGRA